MSVGYTIKIKDLFSEKLKNLIGEWASQTGFEDIYINKFQEIDKYFVFCKGSIRGIYVSIDEKFLKKEFYIKINTLSSKVDWEMVYSIVKFLGNKYNIEVNKETTCIPARKLSKEFFIKKYEEAFELDLKVLKTVILVLGGEVKFQVWSFFWIRYLMK